MQLRQHLCGLAILCALAGSGCKVGPNYHVPAMPAPPSYSNDGHYGDWTSARPADDADRGAWWTIYRNAELNDLELRCAKSNQTIEAALHAYEQAHDLVRESRSSLYPTISVGVGAGRDRVSANKPLRTLNSTSDYWDFTVPINVSWEPDLWGRVRRQVEASTANAQASAANLANVRLSLQGALAATYFQLRGLDLQAQLLQSSLEAFAQSLQLTQVRLKGGVASQTDVAQAQAQLESTRAQRVDLGVQRALYEHAIAVLVGEPAINFHIPEQALAGDPPVVPPGLPSELLQRRPDIAAAERQVAAANAQIGVATAALYPSLNLGAQGGFESAALRQLFNADSSEWALGPSASQVLYDAGRRRSQIDYANAQRAQSTALYRQQVLSAFRDVEDQLSTLRVLEQEAQVQQRAVDAAKQSTSLSLLRYKSGLATYLEVLTNQTIELTNERAAASLVSRRIVASAQLQLALGGGWDSTQLPKN